MGTNTFEIWQDGLRVASGFGPREYVEREAAHYAMIYGQDGPVTVKINGRVLPIPSDDRGA